MNINDIRNFYDAIYNDDIGYVKNIISNDKDVLSCLSRSWVVDMQFYKTEKNKQEKTQYKSFYPSIEMLEILKDYTDINSFVLLKDVGHDINEYIAYNMIKKYENIAWKWGVPLTLISMAILEKKEDEEYINGLKSLGANIDITDKYGKTALFYLAQKEYVQKFVKYGANIEHKDNFGRTIIHYARTPGIVDLCKEYGLNINEKDNYGNTPLHYARNPNLAKYMVGCGAGVSITNNRGRTPLMSNINQKQTFNYLLSVKGAGGINYRDNNQRTPLHGANSADIVRNLISKGADVNAQDIRGRTPIFGYVFGETLSFDVFKELLDKGANINIRDNANRTLLFYANKYEIAEYLINNGFSVNDKDIFGRTPLHEITDGRVIKLLIENGADVNAKDEDGDTPLHNVINETRVFLLIENGADVNAQNDEGRTPLHIVDTDPNKKSQFFDANQVDDKLPLSKLPTINAIELLIKKGAIVNAQDNEGRTPLDYVRDIIKNCSKDDKDRKDRMEGIEKILLEAGAQPGLTEETNQ